MTQKFAKNTPIKIQVPSPIPEWVGSEAAKMQPHTANPDPIFFSWAKDAIIRNNLTDLIDSEIPYKVYTWNLAIPDFVLLKESGFGIPIDWIVPLAEIDCQCPNLLIGHLKNCSFKLKGSHP